MTSKQQPLPLRDIHLPDAVSWWPPAPGWWLSLAVLLLLLWLFRWLLGKRKKPVLNKRAVAEVESVIQSYRGHCDKLTLVQDLSATLKRIGMSYFTRENAAAESGVNWLERLNALVDRNRLDDLQVMLLAAAPYQKAPELRDDEIDALIDQVRCWAAALPRIRREKVNV